MGIEGSRFNIALKNRGVKTWCKCMCTTLGVEMSLGTGR